MCHLRMLSGRRGVHKARERNCGILKLCFRWRVRRGLGTISSSPWSGLGAGATFHRVVILCGAPYRIALFVHHVAGGAVDTDTQAKHNGKRDSGTHCQPKVLLQMTLLGQSVGSDGRVRVQCRLHVVLVRTEEGVRSARVRACRFMKKEVFPGIS